MLFRTSTSGYSSRSRRGLTGSDGRFVSRQGMYRQVRAGLGLATG